MKKKEKKELERVHVFYSGRVQGVGFRYTAEKLALGLKLAGWVKNLPDGRVELLCEGPREVLEDLLGRIETSSVGTFIKKTDRCWEKATNEFKDFCVEFCY